MERSSDKSPNDTIHFILDAHFESFVEPNILTLVNSWKNEEDNSGLKAAILFFYRAANYTKDNFTQLLQSEFGATYLELESEGLKESYLFLDQISDHCCGILVSKSNPIIRQCAPLVSMSPESIERQAGSYFRDKIQSYLRENYPEIIYENDDVYQIANDGRPPSPSVSAKLSSPVISKQMHK